METFSSISVLLLTMFFMLTSLIVIAAIILIRDCIKSPTWQNKVRIIFTLLLIPIWGSAMYFSKEVWDNIGLTDPTALQQSKIASFLIITYTLILSAFIVFREHKHEKKNDKQIRNTNKLIIKLLVAAIFLLTIMLTIDFLHRLTNDVLVNL